MSDLARGHILFEEQELVGSKTVRVKMLQDILIAKGDIVEIEFNDVVGPFIVSIVREISWSDPIFPGDQGGLDEV